MNYNLKECAYFTGFKMIIAKYLGLSFHLPPYINESQKLCILVNIVDTLFADGNAAKEEQETFAKFLAAFGVSEESFKSHFETIAVKNQKSVFFN